MFLDSKKKPLEVFHAQKNEEKSSWKQPHLPGEGKKPYSGNICKTGSRTVCFTADTAQSTPASGGVEEKIVSVLICLEDFGAICASALARLFTEACKLRPKPASAGGLLVFKSSILNCWIVRWRAQLQIVLLSDPFVYLIYITAHIRIFMIQFSSSR